MKASELMIGDWVYDTILKGNTRVEMLSLFGIKGDFHENVYNENTFEPIPLTPEILEKNGIKLEEVGDNGISTPSKWRNRFEKWVLRTQWKDTFIWYDRTAKYWHLHDMGAAKLLYVHELQNALRLCGIEKDIVL